MDKLSELYNRYSNFTVYRNEALNSVEEENSELKLEIKKLELEKKQVQLEYEMKIHELKSQMNTTRAKSQLNDELSQEKSELKKELYSEIAKHYEHGMSAREIANQLGLRSTTLIYQALGTTKADANKEPVINVDWHYYDNSAIHRYAVSDDRQYIKVHGAEDKYKIITVDGLRFVTGDQDVSANAKRIKTALEMFDGTFEGDSIDRPNPYADREAA